MRKLVLDGERFGRLTALRENGKTRSGKRLYLCECDCGNLCDIPVYALTKGESRSCGCLKRERFFVHGKSGTELYKIWDGMLARCYKKKTGSYKNYGARGITVCDSWQDKEQFFAWAYSAGFKDGMNLSIERKNNNLGYCPENCAFIDRRLQNRNRRNVIRHMGRPLVEICEEIGLSKDYKTIRHRISIYGWDVERALSTPIIHKKRR